MMSKRSSSPDLFQDIELKSSLSKNSRKSGKKEKSFLSRDSFATKDKPSSALPERFKQNLLNLTDVGDTIDTDYEFDEKMKKPPTTSKSPSPKKNNSRNPYTDLFKSDEKKSKLSLGKSGDKRLMTLKRDQRFMLSSPSIMATKEETRSSGKKVELSNKNDSSDCDQSFNESKAESINSSILVDKKEDVTIIEELTKEEEKSMSFNDLPQQIEEVSHESLKFIVDPDLIKFMKAGHGKFRQMIDSVKEINTVIEEYHRSLITEKEN